MAHDPTTDFPRLKTTQWRELEKPTNAYNCIAWAIGDKRHRYWPADPQRRWISGLPTLPVRATFAALFKLYGYEPCADGNHEIGFEKIALYERLGIAKHAAYQRQDGKWTSKLGDLALIEHELVGLEGDRYGTPTAYFRRPTKNDREK